MELEKTEPHFNIWIDENDIIAGAKDLVKNLRPSWHTDHLSYKVFTNGISNKLVGFWNCDEYKNMVLVRVYGHKTDLLIDRQEEIKNIRILHKAGHTHSIYATFNNGLAYEFIEGDTLTAELARKKEIYELVSRRMAEMHLLKIDNSCGSGIKSQEPAIWYKTEKFINLIPKSFDDPEKQAKFEKLIQTPSTLICEYHILKESLSKIDSPIVFCHNDLLLTNILHNHSENKVTFIDFEYASYNYQAFDIANHFTEFSGVDEPDYSQVPEEEFQRRWLKIYLMTFKRTSKISEDAVTKLYKQVNQFVLLTHIFWGFWALVQSRYSLIEFDFIEYASIRFNEYFRRKLTNESGESTVRNI